MRNRLGLDNIVGVDVMMIMAVMLWVVMSELMVLRMLSCNDMMGMILNWDYVIDGVTKVGTVLLVVLPTWWLLIEVDFLVKLR